MAQKFADKYFILKQDAEFRLSYPTPVEQTEGAFKQLMEGLNSLRKWMKEERGKICEWDESRWRLR